LNLSYFISKRINSSKNSSFSSTIHKIAVAGIAIGLAIMIVSYLILGGFRNTIQDKIFSFTGHIHVTKFTLGNTFEEEPISINNDLYKNYNQYNFIEHVQEFSHKAGLLKTNEEVLGVLLKGVGKRFNLSDFENNIIDGSFIDFPDTTYSNDVVISQKIANTLKLDVGSEILIYFVQNPPRFRKITISGIYSTGLEDFDEKIIIGDIRMIQRLNNWADTLVGGFEVFIKDPGNIEEAEDEIIEIVDYDLSVQSVTDRYLQIFDWLSLLNRNVIIFLALILFVAAFNMVAILLILIMERTQMIGVFKALGSSNEQIRELFLYNGMLLVLKGLALGNLIGIGFGVIQDGFKVIPLDPENYYMEYVPIEWNWAIIILVNILTFGLVTFSLMIPTMVISRINPIKAIKFS
jgi:lipoprotein-releasing system permease protein